MTGRIIGVTSNAVIVDVGYKSEGLIPIEEFTDRGGELSVKVGEEVDVLLEKTEDLEGHVLLSYSKALRMRRWTEVERAYKDGRDHQGPDHRPHQGRPDGGRRPARVPAGLAGGHQAGQEPGVAARPGAGVQGHQPRPPAQQHRPVAQGRAGDRAGEEEGRDPEAAGGGRAAARRGQEHHRLRRVHRPRRHRRPAPHHRHLLGPGQPPLRALHGGRRGRGGRAQVRPRDRARLARLQAAQRRSLDAGRQEVPDRLARPGPGGLASSTTAPSSRSRRGSRA